MSVNEGRRKVDFAQYDSMSTEELEQILRQDAEAPAEQESDTEKILYVMEVLAKRNRETNRTGTTPQEAWESFQEHYAPEKDSIKSDRPIRPWVRRLIAAAAAVVLILCIPVTARAFGWEELWDVVARWAKETFSFISGESEQVNEPVAEDSVAYSSLQDLLKRNNRPSDMIPTWIPDGFILEDINKFITPEQEVYSAYYANNNDRLMIRVQAFISPKIQSTEIDGNVIEIFEHQNSKYYVFRNLDQLQVIWMTGSYECCISGNISLEIAERMINSIKEG